MARKFLSLEITGLEEFTKDLDALGENLPIAARVAMEAESEVVEEQIKSNWLAAGGSPNGAMYQSISSTSNYAPEGSPRVGAFGKVGVFHIPRLLVKEGSDENPEKKISRPQLAYWFEFGTQAHSTLPKGSTGERMNAGLAPTPFITTAYYSTLEQQQRAAITAWNDFVEKYA